MKLLYSFDVLRRRPCGHKIKCHAKEATKVLHHRSQTFASAKEPALLQSFYRVPSRNGVPVLADSWICSTIQLDEAQDQTAVCCNCNETYSSNERGQLHTTEAIAPMLHHT